jgi:hypothetical protein
VKSFYERVPLLIRVISNIQNAKNNKNPSEFLIFLMFFKLIFALFWFLTKHVYGKVFNYDILYSINIFNFHLNACCPFVLIIFKIHKTNIGLCLLKTQSWTKKVIKHINTNWPKVWSNYLSNNLIYLLMCTNEEWNLCENVRSSWNFSCQLGPWSR